jgi:hypothetical protein
MGIVIVLAAIGLSLVRLHVQFVVCIKNMTVIKTGVNQIFSNFIIEKACRVW